MDFDDVTLFVRLTWRERLGAWFLSLYDVATEEPVLLNRRVTPQMILTVDVLRPGEPPGEILVRGPEHYKREALGTAVVISYLSEDDLRSSPDNTNLVVR